MLVMTMIIGMERKKNTVVIIILFISLFEFSVCSTG